jgi:hypothetical protein
MSRTDRTLNVMMSTNGGDLYESAGETEVSWETGTGSS